jgi:16S rRNA (uracil1498-N3)-methyltransferase
MNRFFVSEENLPGDTVVLGREQAHQIRNVLRMEAGERVVVLDNRGWEYEVILTTVGRDEVAGRVAEKRPASGEPRAQITLYQSLLKRDKFEWVLQKCTEVGVSRFVPVVTERSIVRDAAAVTPSKLTRWRRIITEAAEQCGRGRIPELAPPAALGEVVSEFEGFDCCLVSLTQGGGEGIRRALRRGDGTPATIAVLTGPEGGFTEEEGKLCRDSGAIAISLGERILRTETAAVVAASLILYELGELEG